MSMNMNTVYCHLHQRKYVAIVHILMMYVIQKAAMLAIATHTHTDPHIMHHSAKEYKIMMCFVKTIEYITQASFGDGI